MSDQPRPDRPSRPFKPRRPGGPPPWKKKEGSGPGAGGPPPWKKREGSGPGAGGPPPWKKREGSGPGAGGPPPWKKREGSGPGAGGPPPWKKREGSGPGAGGPPPWKKREGGFGSGAPRPPWQKRDDRPGGGGPPPWKKREGSGPGGPGAPRPPWQKRDDRPGGGGPPPWKKREGASGSGAPRPPWQKRDDRPGGGGPPPWKKREGAGGPPPWKKRDDRPAPPWKRREAPAAATPAPAAAPAPAPDAQAPLVPVTPPETTAPEVSASLEQTPPTETSAAAPAAPAAPAAAPEFRPRPKRDTSWQAASRWYDDSVGEAGHFYHQTVVIPGVLRMLRLGETECVKLLDLACGQGVLARTLPVTVEYWGVDLSEDLIASAKKQDPRPTRRYIHGNACGPLPFEDADFTHAACVLALQNVDKPEALIATAAAHLAPGGRLVLAMNHPCFRIPKQSSWGEDMRQRIRYRRMDRYLSRQRIAIKMNPSLGDKSPETWSFHAPLSDVFGWFRQAGLYVETLEEWVSNKKSAGPASVMENRARAEFPLFLSISAVKPR